MTNAERQRRHKAKLSEAGFVQVNLWLPLAAVPSFQQAAERCRENGALSVARLVNADNGKLAGLKAPKRPGVERSD
jgi:hypothetical protein